MRAVPDGARDRGFCRRSVVPAGRRGQRAGGPCIGPLEADRNLKDLRDLGLVTDAAQDDIATLALARRRNLSGYDAAYLETAKRRGAEIATFDKALARAAAEESIAATWD